MDYNLEELTCRLKQGDFLELTTGGGVFEVWAEPYANPPSVYYEGEQFPLSELETIAKRILDAIQNGEVRLRWVDKRDD